MNSKKDEDSGALNLSNLDKSTVLLDTRAFNESPINPIRCRMILAKLLALIYQSVPLSSTEATDAFFSITKLFMANSVPLRQIVYLAIKELAPVANDVMMATSSLTKDINAKTDTVYRSNAIRALCKITDATLIQGIERFIKQALVDKVPAVSSAALVCSFHLYNLNKEIVRRWANEVQEALNSKGVITQYHALGLLFQIRQHDRMAIIKLIQNCQKLNLRSPHAHCMIIRYASKIMDEEDDRSRSLLDLLEAYLRHKSDMVVYEAARAICSLKNVTVKELTPAVAALQLMLVNHKPALRFAAVRTLNFVSMIHPVAVWPCNLDMENLITDPNRSIATFAITTLLKTGTEASVDRLMKQIDTFMSEISEEFKVIIIDAIRSLSLKFPAKQAVMLPFLSNVLRDEGGFEYKRAIVEAIFDMIQHIPECKEAALGHLCEFIEDCEFSKLAVRILHLLGTHAPLTSAPSKYIRFIYNRVILENALVRSAAVTALAKLAVAIPDLRDKIEVILSRCLDDSDDEVRDRAIMYLRVIRDQRLSEKYVADDSTYSWASFEQNLVNYLADKPAQQQPFDVSKISVVTKEQEEAEKLKQKAFAQEVVAQSLPASSAAAKAAPVMDRVVDKSILYKKTMEQIPSLAALGLLLQSSSVSELTEADVEYVVSCVKHMFPKHIVFQFDVKNTVPNILLESVTVDLKMTAASENGSLSPGFILPLPECKFDTSGTTYVVFQREGTPLPTFSTSLKYTVKEVDDSGVPDGDEYEDEYVMEDLEMTIGDYIKPRAGSSFSSLWESLGQAPQTMETYTLTAVNSCKDADENIKAIMNMTAHSSTPSDRATTHITELTGTFVGDLPLAVRCRMALDPGNGITLEVTVRCPDEATSELVANSIC